MQSRIMKEDLKGRGFYKLAFALFLSLCLSAMAFGQANDNAKTKVIPTAVEKNSTTVPAPLMKNYKGIEIGMTADEVRDKLGKPKTESENGFSYDFSDTESAQITLDADKKVRMISVMYLGNVEKAPKYSDVLGGEAKAATKPDGSIYNLIDYPQAGYWVAYSRTAGESPIIVITMQKMRQPK